MSKRLDERRGRKTVDEQPERVESSAIPVVEERLEVGKREVESGRVIVSITPEVRKEVVEVPVLEETAVIERVPVNRVVEKMEGARQEGEVTVVPVYEEVLFVEKRLVLKEEVRIARRKQTHQERRDVELRAEKVETRRHPPEGGAD